MVYEHVLKQCGEVLKPFPNPAQKQELLADLTLACYTTCEFQRIRQELLQAGRDPAQPEEYIRAGAPFFPDGLGWERLPALSGRDRAPALLELLLHIVQCVPALKGTVRPELWEGRVGAGTAAQLVEIFDELYRQSRDGEADVSWTALLERILCKASLQTEGQRFYTPRQVGRLLRELLSFRRGTLYDPSCCMGNLLYELARDLPGGQLRVCGHEGEEHAWRMAKLFLYFAKIPADLGEEPEDVLAGMPAPALQADVVVGNPPFQSRGWQRGETALREEDPRWKYGVPPRTNGNLAWLQHMLYMLKDPGRMAVVMNVSSLSSTDASETGIRKGIVEDGLLEGILLMPADMFYGTKTAVSIWILAKGRRQKDSTLMVDARKLGTAQGRQTVLDDQSRQKIVDACRAFERGERFDQTDFCTCVTPEQLAQRDWALDPKQYIDYPPPPVPEWEELDEQERKLMQEWERLVRDNAELLRQLQPDRTDGG